LATKLRLKGDLCQTTHFIYTRITPKSTS